MVTYKEQMASKKMFVLLDVEKNEVVGVFGNLKKVCKHMENADFPSYWTLARREDRESRMDLGKYSVQKVKVY